MKRGARFLFIAAALLAVTAALGAQSQPLRPSGASYAGGSVDQINLANLQSHISVNVNGGPGLGDLSLEIPFSFDSMIWNNVGGIWSPSGQVLSSDLSTQNPFAGEVTYSQDVESCSTGYGWDYFNVYYDFGFIDPQGVYHPAGYQYLEDGYPSDCDPSQDPGYPQEATVDLTDGYTMDAYPGWGIVYSSSGFTYRPEANGIPGQFSVTDRFGNTLSGTTGNDQNVTITDSLGHSWLIQYGGWGMPAAAVTVGSAFFTLQTAFNCPGVGEFSQSVKLPTDIIVNQNVYKFTYEQTPGYASGYTTGRIASITLPTGGTIAYSYPGSNDDIDCANGDTNEIDRTVSDGVNSYTTTYVRADGTPSTTTITNQAGTANAHVTLDTFNGVYEVESQVYSGTTQSPSDLLWTEQRCYNATIAANWTACTTTPVGNAISLDQEFELPNGRRREVTTDFLNDRNGVFPAPTEIDQGDWGTSGEGGPWLKKTLIAYYGDAIRMPTQIKIEDGNGNVAAETDLTYVSGTNLYAAPIQIQSQTGTKTLSQSFVYNSNYTLATVTGVNGDTITYHYDPNTCNGDFPVSVTDAGTGLSTSTQWNCLTGEPTQTTDENGNATNYIYNSSTDPTRLTQVTYPDGGEADIVYDDTVGQISVETKRKMNANGQWTDSFENFDGLGRETSTAALNSSGSYDRTDVCYDGDGNVDFTSYPYTASSSGGAPNCAGVGDKIDHDALGRPVSVTHSDGTQALISYTGAATETQGEGNGSGRVARITQSDGLGRLSAVCEVTGQVDGAGNVPGPCNLDIAATGFLTTYQYSTLGGLTEVSQGAETRVFTYDELGRALTASNPESGAATMAWDSDPACPSGWGENGSLAAGVDAAGALTCFKYDAAGREVEQALMTNGEPDPANSVTFTYGDTAGLPAADNAKGHLVYVTNNNGSVQLAYNQFDAMGRPEELDSTIGANTWYTRVNYDYIGFPVYERLPSARHLYLTEHVSGRPAWIGDGDIPGDGNANYPYIQERDYQPWGAPYYETLGNGVSQVWHFDQRMRPTEIDVHPTGDYNWPSPIMDESIGYNPDSTVSGVVDNDGDSAQDYSYSYNALNQLTQWSTGAGLTCGYWQDRYGNVTDSSGKGNCGLQSETFNADNRIVGRIYDADGRPMSDTVGTSWNWDPVGELSGFQQSGQPAYGYVYDGLGRRVEKTENGAVVATYIYNPLGDMSSELDGSVYTDYINAPASAPVAGAAPAPEARIAAVVGAGGVSPIYYFHTDQVGTTRAITDGNGNNIANCGQNASYPNGSFLEYTPFGGPLPGGCGQSTLPYTFAGQYQDAESGQQAFLARYYSDTTARFITPDPAGLAAADPLNPQSWNEYAYVDGQPLTSTDPTGLFPWSSLLPWNWNLCGGDCGGQPWDLPIQDLTALIDGLIAQFPQAGPPPLQHISTSTSHQPQRGQIATGAPGGPTCPSAAAIGNFLAGSPLAGQAGALMTAGNKYGVDPRFIVGLADAETSLGRNLTRGAYNAWNWMYNTWPEPSPFSSWANGIQVVSRGIAQGQYYFTQNRYSAASIYYTPGQLTQYCTAGNCTEGLQTIDRDLQVLGGDPSNVRLPAACTESGG